MTLKNNESLFYSIRRMVSLVLVGVFSFTTIITPVQAEISRVPELPVPGVMVNPSQSYEPVLLKGLTLHPEDPLRFDFIIDSGQSVNEETQIQRESERLIKYFLASMTVPKDDLWVNLSPYEGDKIIPTELSRTELGRDLLAQDYLLKQLTASLIYPEKELGADFWDKIYQKAQTEYGTTDIPLDTFNKVWILPERAEIYRHGETVYVVNARMKVMLDSDYQAVHNGIEDQQRNISADIVREVLLPVIEREVNEGENFAALRQIYYSLILAKWYKQTITDSLLHKVYVDQNMVAGVDGVNDNVRDEIYNRYMQAYEKGVFNYIKEDYNRLSGDALPRKYFSGGFKDADITIDQAVTAEDTGGDKYLVAVNITAEGAEIRDNAMMSRRDFFKWGAVGLMTLATPQIAIAQDIQDLKRDQLVEWLSQENWSVFERDAFPQIARYGQDIVPWLQREFRDSADENVRYNAMRALGMIDAYPDHDFYNSLLLNYRQFTDRDLTALVMTLSAQLQAGHEGAMAGLRDFITVKRDITEAHIIAANAMRDFGEVEELDYIKQTQLSDYQGDPVLLDEFSRTLEVSDGEYAAAVAKRIAYYVGISIAGLGSAAVLYLVARKIRGRMPGDRFLNLRALNGSNNNSIKRAAKQFFMNNQTEILLDAKKNTPVIHQALVEIYEGVPQKVSRKVAKIGRDVEPGAKEVANPDYDKNRAEIRKFIRQFEEKHNIDPGYNFGPVDEALMGVKRPDSEVGGIDMNSIAVRTHGTDSKILFDEQAFNGLIDQPVQGFTPVIINVTPLPSILPLLGLQPTVAESTMEVSHLSVSP